MSLSLFSSLNRRIGIDLGSSTTRIWSDQSGLVISEPTCLAVDERTKKVLAVGLEAQAMSGRVGEHIKVYYPIQNSALHDFESARAMLKVFLQRVFHSPYFFRPIIMVSLPSASTEANRAALTDLVYSVGAREVYTINQSLAAAIGAGVPIADASGSFVMHLGSGTVEAAIISLGSVVVKESSTYAGAYADTKIKHTLKEAVGLLISDAVAERLKREVGSVMEHLSKEQLATGQDAAHSSPREVMINSALIRPPLVALAERYEQLLKKLLSNIPPELTADVIDKGMLLSGAFSQLLGLDQYLVGKLGIPVSVVEEPDKVVIKGIQSALENLELFKESLGYQR